MKVGAVALEHQPFDAWTVGSVAVDGTVTVVMMAGGAEGEVALRNVQFGFLEVPLQPSHGNSHSVEMGLLTPAFAEVATSTWSPWLGCGSQAPLGSHFHQPTFVAYWAMTQCHLHLAEIQFNQQQKAFQPIISSEIAFTSLYRTPDSQTLPLPPWVRLDLSASGGGYKRNGVVRGSISQIDTRCCLSPAVDSSHPTCKITHETSTNQHILFTSQRQDTQDNFASTIQVLFIKSFVLIIEAESLT